LDDAEVDTNTPIFQIFGDCWAFAGQQSAKSIALSAKPIACFLMGFLPLAFADL
jgi:hypothetical protein